MHMKHQKLPQPTGSALCRKELWLDILQCVSLDSFEADETSEECGGEENESKRISVYITPSVCFPHLLILSTPVHSKAELCYSYSLLFRSLT